MRSIVALLFALVAAAPTAAAAGSLQHPKRDDKKTTTVAESILDTTENGIVKAWHFTRHHRLVFQGVTGALIVAYGSSFKHLLLLYKAVSFTGMPVITSNLRDVGETYRRTREALRQDLPAILQAKAQHARLQAQLDNVSEKMAATRDTALQDKLRAEAMSLKLELSKIKAVSDHVSHLIHAINPKHLQDVTHQIYLSVLAGAAAISSTYAQVFTIGASLARQLTKLVHKAGGTILRKHAIKGSRTLSALEHLAEQESRWLRTVANGLSHATGIVVAVFLKPLAMAISASMIGVHLLFEAAEEALDPLLERAKMPTLKQNPTATAVLQGAVAAAGVAAQLRFAQPPRLIRILLCPIMLLDHVLEDTLL